MTNGSDWHSDPGCDDEGKRKPVRDNDLGFAGPRHDAIHCAIHSLCDLSPGLTVLNAASMIQSVIMRWWDLARIEACLPHAAGRTIAELTEITCGFDWAVKAISDDRSGLRCPQKI